MKRLLILLFAIPLLSTAQDKLYVLGTSPDLYLNHVVAPKEGFYKIARSYNVDPHKLAAYNTIDFDKGPNVGATIKIPLTDDNFSQDGKAADDETLIPLYHIIQEKEGLYHISTTYNKVPIANLKKWNDMQGEAINKGSSFIIGYLKVKKNLSTLGSATDNTPTAAPQEEPTTVPVKETPKPVVAPPVKTQPKPQPAAVETPVTATTEVPAKETPAPTLITPVIKAQPVKQAVINEPAEGDANLSEGIFKTDYLRQAAKENATTETGNGASFKSTSGWVDGKYYCLENNAVSGTVIKITNTDNGKTIYAKVLEPIADISQNGETMILVSNAAAEALGAGKDGKFNCTIEYSK